MAASVLLSAESTVSSFSVGNPGAAGATGNGLSAPGPASWNRSLDRALDEATATGCLNLSGRKLKEFPRSAASHDLTDTTRAGMWPAGAAGRKRRFDLHGARRDTVCYVDLSRNRLSELPVEVCMFVSLENLNLYQNCLRSLPESLINLQALTYLNISRNQLPTLPAHVCSLPLKVLIACNNKLVSLPEELGQLRQLTELDVSCNEIQTLPAQVGQLEALRDLNIRRNHLVRLPPELAELPLVRLDFSCNKVTVIPVCYRNLRHLQSMVLDNNPLQSPPAQICIKGKIHIFKYLNMEACKIAPELPDYDRRPLGFGSCVEDIFPSRPYGALDSGFNSVDSGDKRWSGNEPSDELSDLPLRVAEITKEQRQRRDREQDESRTGSIQANGTLETELEQIDFIDSCTGEEEEEDVRTRTGDSVSLSSQFMAYIERRITREGSPVKACPSRDMRTEGRPGMLSSRSVTLPDTMSPTHVQRALPGSGVERARREAQLAAQRYEEERHKVRNTQKDAVRSYTKYKSAYSPSNLSPPDSENLYPSRRSTHTDDSALFMSVCDKALDGVLCPDPAPSCSLQQGEDRTSLSASAFQSPAHPGPAAPPPCRGSAQRPESFLFRIGQREEKKRGESRSGRLDPEEVAHTTSPAPGPTGEEAELLDQLRKNIESRLKVSLPNDLGAALTDGVVLCHLANHVRPRSVPSIHVPSPAVPKLTMAKCRRNVENFLEACRRIGVPQGSLCSAAEVLQGEALCLHRLVQALLSLAPSHRSSPPSQLAGFALFYLSVMSLLCALYCHLVPRI
ncbi:DISP complex protein LRCH3 isoform X3 [Brachyhypopomus gauderio]|uniref:DISP complex protein LRCH3 isoform X3 n=1 Tax=Brachyhypopomus gauderio TaxID=698409 RepID=UPI004043734F